MRILNDEFWPRNRPAILTLRIDRDGLLGHRNARDPRGAAHNHKAHDRQDHEHHDVLDRSGSCVAFENSIKHLRYPNVGWLKTALRGDWLSGGEKTFSAACQTSMLLGYRQPRLPIPRLFFHFHPNALACIIRLVDGPNRMVNNARGMRAIKTPNQNQSDHLF